MYLFFLILQFVSVQNKKHDASLIHQNAAPTTIWTVIVCVWVDDTMRYNLIS